MATLGKSTFSRILIACAVLVCGWLVPSNQSQADVVDPACFRLEGLFMPCAGGGGVCNEACDSGRQAEICRDGSDGKGGGYKICGHLGNGGVTCSGTKCCDTCEGEASKYSQCAFVQACGQACSIKGTKPNPDCSKARCTTWVETTGTVRECWQELRKGQDQFTCTGSCHGDGCSNSCGVSGNQCVVPGPPCNCTCNPGIIKGEDYYVTVCRDSGPVQCWSTASVPRISDGNCGCKCPEGLVTAPPSGALRCGQSVTIPNPNP